MTLGPIIVTGAGGFVGSEIAVQLRHAGYEVIGVDCRFDGSARRRMSDIRLVEAKIDLGFPDLADIKPYGVIHAAAVTASPKDFGLSAAEHVSLNINLLTNVLTWSQKNEAKRFIFLSSSGVFRAEDSNTVLCETTPATATGPYAAAKRAGEEIVRASSEGDFVTICLRLGNLFGEHEISRPTRQNVSLVQKMIDQATMLGTITVETPMARRDWTYVSDIGRVCVSLLRSFPVISRKIMHCCSDEIFTDLELARLIAITAGGATVTCKDKGIAMPKAPLVSEAASALSNFKFTPVEGVLQSTISRKVVA